MDFGNHPAASINAATITPQDSWAPAKTPQLWHIFSKPLDIEGNLLRPRNPFEIFGVPMDGIGECHLKPFNTTLQSAIIVTGTGFDLWRLCSWVGSHTSRSHPSENLQGLADNARITHNLYQKIGSVG